MAMKERVAISSSGWFAILLGLGSLAASALPFSMVPRHADAPAMYVLGGIGLIIFGFILLGGCFVIGPNEARVLTFFGRYVGTVKDPGLRWANPFTSKRPVSLRARNFETAKIKVNSDSVKPTVATASAPNRPTKNTSTTANNDSSTISRTMGTASRRMARFRLPVV